MGNSDKDVDNTNHRCSRRWAYIGGARWNPNQGCRNRYADKEPDFPRLPLGSHLSFSSGGIKAHNLLRTLHGSVSTTGHSLDGVAIVSEIVASPEPRLAAERLSSIIRSFKALSASPSVLAESADESHARILEGVTRLIEHVRDSSPLIHQVSLHVKE